MRVPQAPPNLTDGLRALALANGAPQTTTLTASAEPIARPPGRIRDPRVGALSSRYRGPSIDALTSTPPASVWYTTQ